ncbi:MAG: methyltransferase domain-containing protein [Bacteroidales bacterium]|jgi:SAM-dependent methyltransferase|nr:methyltransferase domain-containing protein [Bacteroidales bacterium]
MQYDPVKRSLGNVFNKAPWLRKLFYNLLDILLLRAWYIKREIKKLYSKDRNQSVSVLDAGSGYGQYDYFVSSYLKKSDILGVDVKQEQIDDCNDFFTKIKRQDRVKFEYADLTEFSKPDTYNLVLSVDVMEHILEDEKVFKNICTSLKKDGVLLISTPSDQGGSDVHHEGEHSFIDEHVRDGYNINDIETKLKNAGFSKVESKYSYGTPGSIAWLLSMKWPILMLNCSKLFFILLIPYYIVTFPFAFVLDWIDTITSHKTGTGLIVKAVK